MWKYLYHWLGNGTLSLDLIVSQVHTSIKAWKGTCIYYGVILIVVQGEEGEERSASSEEDHTVWPTTGGSPVELGQRSASA